MQEPLWLQPGEAYFMPVSMLPHPEDHPLDALWRYTRRAQRQGARRIPYIIVADDVFYSTRMLEWFLADREGQLGSGLPACGPEEPYRCLAIMDAPNRRSILLADVDGCTLIAAVPGPSR